jgi:cell division protein FtsZ
MRRAKEGIKKLHEYVDSLIVIPNEKLNTILEKNGTSSFTDACLLADDVLRQGVQGISEIITLSGVINTDFADVKNTMQGKGNAIFGIGVSEGENRAVEAATAAINNPMLENSNIDGATHILINICASDIVSLPEIKEMANIVTASADKDHEVCWGQNIIPEMEGKIRVTVIATGFENKVQNKPEPVKVPVVEEPIIKDENVIDTSEFSKILNNTITSSTDSGVKSSDSLNGSFVTKDELNTNSYGSFAGLSQKEPAKENSERQSWGQSLFDNDVQKEISNNNANFFAPPPGFVPNSGDLSQPAIWNNSNYGRSINLTDD